jgi:hypothetical protein
MENSKTQDQNRAKKRLWQVHARACKKSGLSQNEYCRRNKLKPSQFYYWKNKFGRKAETTTKFVPVTVQPLQVAEYHDHADSGLTISFDKITIRLKNDFNPSSLVKVVNALGGKT